MYLKVAPGGSRSWILRAVVGRKRRDIGLGGYPDVSVARAREEAKSCREKIRKGIDPVIERKEAKAALVAAQDRELSFKQAATRCHAAKSPEFRSQKHRADWINALERHAFPVIGNMAVSDIGLSDILRVLEPIWQSKTETATRIRQRLEAVLTWATVSGYRDGDNPARWEGNLKEILPTPSKIMKVRHHPALPWQEIGQFMANLRKREGIAARALEFSILTAARTGEVRGMEWSEVDFDAKTWTVPPERIKAGRRHIVPLSDAALAILKDVPRMEGSDYVFTGAKGGPLSNNTMLALLKRMDVDAVPHGFRSTFKDWARSSTAYADEVSELALAHVNSDATRAAYARDELLPKRQRLMEDWAKYCSVIRGEGEVVSLRRQVDG